MPAPNDHVVLQPAPAQQRPQLVFPGPRPKPQREQVTPSTGRLAAAVDGYGRPATPGPQMQRLPLEVDMGSPTPSAPEEHHAAGGTPPSECTAKRVKRSVAGVSGYQPVRRTSTSGNHSGATKGEQGTSGPASAATSHPSTIPPQRSGAQAVSRRQEHGRTRRRVRPALGSIEKPASRPRPETGPFLQSGDPIVVLGRRFVLRNRAMTNVTATPSRVNPPTGGSAP